MPTNAAKKYLMNDSHKVHTIGMEEWKEMREEKSSFLKLFSVMSENMSGEMSEMETKVLYFKSWSEVSK